MRKIFKTIPIFVLFLFLLSNSPALADALEDMGEMADPMSSKTFDNGFLGQDQVSDEAFQKALKEVKDRQNKGKKKKKELKGNDIN